MYFYLFTMLNSSAIVQRIEEIRNLHQLSAAAFAAQIGVQRSAMSHILSGRNKPSLEFLIKIYEAFDDIALDWLILGTPSTLPTQTKTKPLDQDIFDESKNIPQKTKDELPETDHPTTNQSIPSPKRESPSEIIYLYADGSFERFVPKK